MTGYFYEVIISANYNMLQIPGTKLGVYEIVAPLGAGGMGLALIRVAWLGLTTTYKTYKTAGTAKPRVSRTRHRILWVGLWVRKRPRLYC